MGDASDRTERQSIGFLIVTVTLQFREHFTRACARSVRERVFRPQTLEIPRINGIEISIVLGRPFQASRSSSNRGCAPFRRVFPLPPPPPAPLEQGLYRVQRYKNSLFPPPLETPQL